jgi:hypothetical protein
MRGILAPRQFVNHDAVGVSEPPEAVQRLGEAAGVEINGPRPWDIRVHDDALYVRLLLQGSLGVGESSMDEMWGSDCLEETVARLIWADDRFDNGARRGGHALVA